MCIQKQWDRLQMKNAFEYSICEIVNQNIVFFQHLLRFHILIVQTHGFAQSNNSICDTYLKYDRIFHLHICSQTATVSDLWNFSDYKANVICKELGYDHAEEWFVLHFSHFSDEIEAW